MKLVLETIAVAFSMFSAVPVTKVAWKDQNMRFMLVAFPLVGVLCGILEALCLFLAHRFGLPPIMTAALAAALPLIVTGGIHLDGYVDVSDALSSWGNAEKKREILADPHIGAFAVIRLAVYLILYMGFASGLTPAPGEMLLLALSFVLSRSLSALAVSILPLSKESGLAHTFQSTADQRKCTFFLGGWILAVCLGMVPGGYALGGIRCLIAAVLMIGCAGGQWIHLRRIASKQFGGLSGDLNGWYLQKAELWMLAALTLTMHFSS